jgi:NAD(P)-dependent dehydrogenase (short-subunit alcohol dehydrogenase family)
VTKRAEVEALIQKAVDGFGRVDVIVNNAGIMPIAPIEALKVVEWDQQIDVNIKDFYMGLPPPCLTCRSRRAVTSLTSLRFSGSSCVRALSEFVKICDRVINDASGIFLITLREFF